MNMNPEDNLSNERTLCIGSRVRVIMKDVTNGDFKRHMQKLLSEGLDNVARIIAFSDELQSAKIQYADKEWWHCRVTHLEVVD